MQDFPAEMNMSMFNPKGAGHIPRPEEPEKDEKDNNEEKKEEDKSKK